MIDVARVNLWGMMVGAVAWDAERGYAVFEFDKAFIRRGLDIAPFTMPLSQALAGRTIFSFPRLNRDTYRGLPGLLSDSLPDRFGNTLVDAWLAREGRSPDSVTAIDRLCYTGKRGMGALEYEPATGPEQDGSTPIQIRELVNLAREILADRKRLRANLGKNTGQGLEEIIRVGTSAGGARAKAVIAYNKATGEVRSGQIDGLDGFDYWIIKFDGVTNRLLGDPKGYGRIEYAYSLMAKAAGISMTECELLKENRRAHFMTRRFDRIGGRKIHMQTLCAIAHHDYNLPGACSYEQAFQVLRRLRAPYTDMEELYRRMVFNVAARNQDDHTKNLSFLMDEQGEWRLSPAYDVTFAFDQANRWMKLHQMNINGKVDAITETDLLGVAKSVNIRKPKEIIRQVMDAVSRWPEFAREAEVGNEQIRAIGKAHLIYPG